ncbi:MAG: amino acid adenylation domain-containing protein, partial [Thermoanaerobaculia bacterium]
SPLFQAMLAFQKARRPEEAAFAPFALGEEGATLDLGGLILESVALPERRVPFDLTLMMAEAGGGLLASLQYNSDLFDAATAERMLGHFSRLLDGMASTPDRRIADLDLLAEPERRQLAAWAVAPSPGPEECLHRLVGAQVERTPDAVALVRGDRSLTYRELWDRAGALAGRLREAGVGPEVRVGLFAGRTPELVVGMLAVLRAGGAYVPLDPAYPAERLAFLLEDSRAAVVLAEPGRELPRTDALVLPLGEEREAADLPDDVLPANLAYLIYTSGSTGRPKAVALTHASAAALARWAREVFPEEDLAGVLASTSISFDLSVFEIFVPLCWGGRVVLAENALELPRDQDVRLVNTVPSAMAELVRARALPASVRTVNLAAEALPPELVRDLYRTGTVERVFNLYGPSEDTTYSTFALQEQEPRSAPIGLPVSGTGAWLLDAAGLREVPLGARGEIHLGGEGLARGYFGRPGLTAERFVPSPFEPGARLYRTGDLARRRPDGSLEYLGRIDHQVKIRGFRVELGEVEAALRDLPGVREAVVLAVEGTRLAAFVTGAAPDRQALRRRLPEALVPSAIVRLQALPLTPNGKVDRKALARLAAESGPAAVWRAPSTPGEMLLAGIWSEVLGTERMGADDDFFALGGHSLLAARVQARVRERLGVELPLSAFFQAPTVAALALHLDVAAASAVPPLERLPRDGRDFPLSFAQERLWLLERLEPGSAVYHMAGGARLEGPLDIPALRRALAGLAARHEILRTSFPEEGGRPVQRIGSGAPDLPVTGLAALPDAERLAVEEACRPFDLANGLPWRARLLRLGEESHILLLTLHHIAADEESLEVLVEDLAALYREESRPAPFQYADFAAWQRRHLESLEPRLDWWAERLAGLPTLELPADRPGAVRGPRGGRAIRELPELTSFDRATPFLVLLAAFQAFLGRVTGADDVPVGCPVSRRDRRELEGAVGLFVNTLVLRGDLSGGPGFREMLGRVRTAVTEAHERDVPFELLVARLRPERTLGRNPLFDAAFALHRPPRSRRLGELALEPLQVHTGTAKFDLTLFALETGSGLTLSLEYASDLFDAATAERLLGGFQTLLAAALAEPDRPLADLPLLTDSERRQLLEWGTGAAFPPSDLPVHRRVEEQAARAPEALAVASDAESITYGELNRRADLLARGLRERGVGPERLVAISLDRSVESVVAALAVLKAGGAYLPLDPAHPQERLAAIVEDSGAF